jgi:hypothetical protein
MAALRGRTARRLSFVGIAIIFGDNNMRMLSGGYGGSSPVSRPESASLGGGSGSSSSSGSRRFGMGSGGAGMMRSFKRGGKVKKTGPAKLHKGERVLTKQQADKAKMHERSGKKRKKR